MRSYPATIHRPGEQLLDEQGNPRRDPTTDQPLYGKDRDIPARCYRVRRCSSVEIVEGRQTLITRTEAALTKDADIRETDKITIDGVRYRVVGLYRERRALPYVHVDLEVSSDE